MQYYKDDAAVFGKNNVSISAIPIFQHGFEINYDRKLANNQWLKFAPIYYKSEDFTPSLATDFGNVQGYGFKFQHKYFPYCHTGSKLGLFLSYGPGFQHFDIRTKGGMEVVFDKYGFECVIGMHKLFADVFFLEFYGGLATNYLRNRSKDDIDWRDVLKQNNSTWFDYAITGNYFVLGINLGILF